MDDTGRLVLDVALVFLGWALGRMRRRGLAKMPKPVIYDLYDLTPERWDWVPFIGYRRVRQRALDSTESYHRARRAPAAGFGAMGKN